MKNSLISGVLLSFPMMAAAAGSPWLPAPESTSVQVSLVNQSADQLWAGDQRVDLPADRDQNTLWVSLQHGLSDDLAVDLRVGYSETDFDPEPEENGITDTSIGLTWRLVDEFFTEQNLPSIAFRAGAIIEGNYDTGRIGDIGDGASGGELEMLIGKAVSESFAVNAGIGYRYRSSATPNEAFWTFNAGYSFTERFSASVGYEYTDSRGNLDIGGAGFSFDRFDEVEEDFELVTVGLNYAFKPDLSVNLTYGEVIDGSNTAKSDVAAITLGTSF